MFSTKNTNRFSTSWYERQVLREQRWTAKHLQYSPVSFPLGPQITSWLRTYGGREGSSYWGGYFDMQFQWKFKLCCRNWSLNSVWLMSEICHNQKYYVNISVLIKVCSISVITSYILSILCVNFYIQIINFVESEVKKAYTINRNFER